jgi:uncharacterized protein
MILPAANANTVNTSLIVMQPTPFCNIDCKYCYLPSRHLKDKISPERYAEIFGKVLNFPTVAGEVTIVWHGGEPLVLGAEYYETAFSCIQRVCPSNLNITHSFQTNGLFLNHGWFDLIEKWNVRVGLSLDGPRAIHDRYRTTRSGAGTFDRCIKGLEGLRNRGIYFSVLTVLTREGIRAPDEMFSFYRGYDIKDVAFNIEEKEGVHVSSSLMNEFLEQEIVVFLDRFRFLMEQNSFYIRIRELEEVLTSINYVSLGAPISTLTVPFGIITITVNGDIHTFCPELAGFKTDGLNSFAIGNVYTDSYEDMCHSDTLRLMRTEINEGIEMCKSTCDYFSICGGGTPSNKLFENGTFASTETMHCRLTRKRIADFLMSIIEEKSRNLGSL